MEKNVKILIIEDEKMLAESLSMMLKAKGFETQTAYDGELGEEYALLSVYDLIILDVMLPGQYGYHFAK